MTIIDPRTGSDWTPEFPSQRPPFQPGNTISVKHGAWSPARLEPVAMNILEAILSDEDLPMLRMPAFTIAVRSYAATAARVQLLEQWVDDMDIRDAGDGDRGKTSPLELLRKWTTTLDNKAARLGLDPVSFAKLHKTVASTKLDLAKLLSDLPDAE